MKAATFLHGDPMAMVVAHPGHELRAFGFLLRYRPNVSVLTDGSGSGGISRFHRSRALFQEHSCAEGCWRGEFSDRDVYRMILAGEADPFIGHARKLADLLIDNKIRTILGDALEGFNPSHDLCRFLIDAAAEVAGNRSGIKPDNLSLVLDASPGKCPDGYEIALRIELSSEEFALKKSAIEQYPELQRELEMALARFGEAPFRQELLLRAGNPLPLETLFPEPPYYETFGEKRRSEGVFQEIIHYHQHLRPLVEKVRRGLGLQ